MTDFAATKARFHIPEGMIYLDGNSLGPMPLTAVERARAVLVEEWADMLITAWNRAEWMDLPRRVGDRVGALVGAAVLAWTLAQSGGADPHALVQALAETQLAVETAVTVRDRVVEAYQEILRMPV